MAKTKTFKTNKDVTAFVNALPDERKRTDSFKLIEIMSGITGEKPYMFGPTIIGFGNYHYKYKTDHEGDAPIAAFSPRKSALTLYTATDFPGKKELLKKLGKHTSAVSCVYIKTLDDIHIPVLKKIIADSARFIKKLYPD